MKVYRIIAVLENGDREVVGKKLYVKAGNARIYRTQLSGSRWHWSESAGELRRVSRYVVEEGNVASWREIANG